MAKKSFQIVIDSCKGWGEQDNTLLCITSEGTSKDNIHCHVNVNDFNVAFSIRDTSQERTSSIQPS